MAPFDRTHRSIRKTQPKDCGGIEWRNQGLFFPSNLGNISRLGKHRIREKVFIEKWEIFIIQRILRNPSAKIVHTHNYATEGIHGTASQNYFHFLGIQILSLMIDAQNQIWYHRCYSAICVEFRGAIFDFPLSQQWLGAPPPDFFCNERSHWLMGWRRSAVADERRPLIGRRTICTSRMRKEKRKLNSTPEYLKQA